MKIVFLKRNKQRQSLICLKNCEMNNLLVILEFCAFYIEYKNAKFTWINFRGQTNVRYFIQTQLLRFCKDTTKVSSLPLSKITTKSNYHFLPAKKKIPILCIVLQTNTKGIKTLHLNTKRLKICKFQRLFRKMWIKK